MTIRPCHLDESRECYADAKYRIRCEMNKEKADNYDGLTRDNSVLISEPQYEGYKKSQRRLEAIRNYCMEVSDLPVARKILRILEGKHIRKLRTWSQQ